MATYLVTIVLILLLLLAWLAVQRAYRLFARHHPELGPFRREEGGCGACSAGKCGGGHCSGEE
ncbi:MAG: chemotaxis protein [Thiobacillaceae bacterium]|jgi:hypothetical protein|nr:chemotaxis protein [Thiobacillaceae bacterium]